MPPKPKSRFDEIMQEMAALADKPMRSHFENTQIVVWALLAGANLLVKQMELAEQEAARRTASTSMKDRFLRAVDSSYLFPDYRDQKIVARAKEAVAQEFDETCEKGARQNPAQVVLPTAAKESDSNLAVVLTPPPPVPLSVSIDQDITASAPLKVRKRNQSPVR